MQAKYKIAEQRDLTPELTALREAAQQLPATGDKLSVTPKVGHELFKIGTLTDKVPQFHLLAEGNPRPETVRVSPLYQITIDQNLRTETAVAAE